MSGRSLGPGASDARRGGATPFVPTREQIAQAAGTRLEDVLAPGLTVVFCGINPGLYSGATGHHFARPGNRFWPVLHRSGWTDRQLSPFEDCLLPRYGAGVTNLVERTTATAAELSAQEVTEGGRRLGEKIARYRPRCVAVLGVTSYRTAFGVKDAGVGVRPERLHGALVWVLPNPSGLNAHYQLPRLVELFAAMRGAVAGG